MKTKKKQRVNRVIEVSLPTEKTKPDSEGKFSLLLFGREKIGKSTFAAQWRKPLFIFTEPGNKELELFEVYVSSWLEFVAYSDLLIKKGRLANFPYETLVFDTADRLWDMVEDFTCEKFAIDHMSDLGYAKAYKFAQKEFIKKVFPLMALSVSTIFTSHEDMREIRTRTGDEVDRIVPSMANSARKILEPVVDLWAYYTYDQTGKHRILQVVGDDLIMAGHRFVEHFQDTKFVNMGGNAEQAYENFMNAYNNKGGPRIGITKKSKKVVKRSN